LSCAKVTNTPQGEISTAKIVGSTSEPIRKVA